MEEPSKMLSDEEIEAMGKRLNGVTVMMTICVLVAMGVLLLLSSCSDAAPPVAVETPEQAAFLQACDDATDCPVGMLCSLGSDVMPGRCTSGCELPQDCYGLLPSGAQTDVACDVDELLCVARCSRTVGCPEALPACVLGMCAPSCNGVESEACWNDGQAQ